MTDFVFIRHGEKDTRSINTGIYQGWGVNMMPLTELGAEQIRAAAEDPRLQGAQLVLTSPYTRAMQTAAILCGRLGLDLRVEEDLHEWCASRFYRYLPRPEAVRNYDELHEGNGHWPAGQTREWETEEIMRERVLGVLNRYRAYDKVIVVSHGTLMQYVLGVGHPQYGEIVEYQMK